MLHFAQTSTVKLNPPAQHRLELHLRRPLIYRCMRIGHDALEKIMWSEFNKASLRFGKTQALVYDPIREQILVPN